MLSGTWKLIQGKGKGKIGDARWSGPLYPKVPATGTEDADCSMGCLYDVLADPGEHNEQSKAFPDITKQLLAKLDEYRKTNFEPLTPNVTIAQVCEATQLN